MGAADQQTGTAGTGSSVSPSQIPRSVAVAGNRLPVGALAATLLVGLVLPGPLTRHGAVVVGVSLLVGLPHGAVDHLVPSWMLQRRLAFLPMSVVLGGYLVAAGGMLLLLRTAPCWALGLFLVLSVLHFGAGEATYDRLRRGLSGARPRRPGDLPRRILDAVAWGGATVLLPICRWPVEVRPVLERLAPGASALLDSSFRVVALGLLAVVIAASAITSSALEHRFRTSAELVLVAATMTVVPALTAFAVYFGWWHSVRHVIRLLATDPANAADLSASRWTQPFLRFLRQAAAPTAVSLVALAGLLAAGSHGLLTGTLQLLAALTVPHMVVVAWMDRRSGTRPLSGAAGIG